MAGRLAGRQLDQIMVGLKIFIVKRVVEARKVGHHVFSCRSLLLSTIVLNDKA